MEPLKRVGRRPKGEPALEKTIEWQLRRALKEDGWLVEKTHGSMYKSGWPDLMCVHPRYGVRWVEVKRPGTGSLEKSQIRTFTRWSKYGLGVWVLTGVKDLHLLHKPPNWWCWLDKDLRRQARR